MTQRITLIPASYPELEREAYLALDLERETIAPPPSSQLTLELACAGLDVEGWE